MNFVEIIIKHGGPLAEVTAFAKKKTATAQI
ncbi:hypothetical protein RSK20926_11524 [Roseobacter sp. SK209-2-6]|nr:hypothetical protein RSK20926_11524 [Roseobacter sp. SK209-2-6]